MKLMIGENMKRLRRERDLTQEELANVLGVSCQSVSRWENGSCYPDVELLPSIAAFFGVSTDKLMGVGEAEEQRFVERSEASFREALSRGKVYECIRIAREGVREYPNNYHLLNDLMYALFIAGDEDGNIPEWHENMERFDDEITRLGERIVKYCPEQALRLEATELLAFNHLEMGRKREARAVYETLPGIGSCREMSNMWRCFEGEDQLDFLRGIIRGGWQVMSYGMYSLARTRLLPDEELLKVYEKMFALDYLVWDGKRMNSCSWDDDYCHMAAVFARMGRTDEAFAALENAARCARAFDGRPEETTYESVLCGRRTERRTDIQMSDDRSFREIMRDKWMKEPDFDAIRDDARFLAIEKTLSE
ncbi:MAG: helix-turn-helix transcriptional regulator [Oscillospiraceae bacterium]|nr:helix-turn-helix transcriptional regulator [Oscillospiraceae bacterium]